MIVKIMPENEFEKQRMQEVEHTGVKEFFIFGNKRDKDEDPIDFHDWSGSYRYLEGSLYHFLTTITEEKKAKSQKTNEISLQPQGQTKPSFIKKGKMEDANVKIINIEELTKKENPSIPFPHKEVKTDEFVETMVIDNASAEAEDKE
jgi:hypothetical protein